jgi:hypothetical protein
LRQINTLSGDPAHIGNKASSSMDWKLGISDVESSLYHYTVTANVNRTGAWPFRDVSTALVVTLPTINNRYEIAATSPASITFQGIGPHRFNGSPLAVLGGSLNSGSNRDLQCSLSVSISYRFTTIVNRNLAAGSGSLSLDPVTGNANVKYDIQGQALDEPAGFALQWLDKDGNVVGVAYEGTTETQIAAR